MIAYLDIPSGISGDIFLGCLLDAGWPLERLRFAIAQLRLPADEYAIDARTVMKGPSAPPSPTSRPPKATPIAIWRTSKRSFSASDLPAAVKHNAVAVFTRLADAEAKVHGTTRDKIHFHEVGAMDAIIDIVGTCAGLHDLGIEKLYAGRAARWAPGWTQSQHGQIPLPAPATLELLAAAKAPTRPAPAARGEWVTPTGRRARLRTGHLRPARDDPRKNRHRRRHQETPLAQRRTPVAGHAGGRRRRGGWCSLKRTSTT